VALLRALVHRVPADCRRVVAATTVRAQPIATAPVTVRLLDRRGHPLALTLSAPLPPTATSSVHAPGSIHSDSVGIGIETSSQTRLPAGLKITSTSTNIALRLGGI
jgi:hypothetical protein